MKIEEVLTRAQKKAWHKFQRDIYKNDPYFSAPIEKMIEKIFTPGKNEFFEKGGCATRFLLRDDNGTPVGRIAAFINANKAYTFQQPTGGCGFFECIDNQDAANLLFDACRDWLSAKGMQAMDGPINFGENDNYWGLLVEGFEPSAWGMNYNFPYYQKLFENYGFKMYFEQVSNILDYKARLPERVFKIADYVAQKGGFFCDCVKMKNIEKYMADMKEVYDDAWQYHENFVPLHTETMQKELDEGKGLIDPDMLLFAYHKDENGRDEPIAFMIMIPDASPVFRRFNGKLGLINKLRFLILKRCHLMTRARITIMGVKIAYQRSGIESLLIADATRRTLKKPWYKDIELSWVGDFNPKMRALHEGVGAVFHQRHYTYRVLFDTAKDFERSTIIAKDTKQQHLNK